MKLPRIQEDEYPLKNTYFTSITQKPLKKYKTDKLVYDWQTAEVQLIARIPDQEEILQCLIELQGTCKKMQVPHFYTYFFVDSLLWKLESQVDKQKAQGEEKTAIIGRVKAQIEELKSKKSKWNKIVQLIQLRQNLVSKINSQVANNRLQDVYSHLDDIRFVNFEIVKKIGEWSDSNKSQSDIHPFFLHEGNNYLIRMINDNANVINVLNGKAVKFLSPPNPFYLSRDGNKASMSQTQQTEIDNCMQILAKAKAQQLRMIINPPKFVSEAKNEAGELKKLKNQLENEKVERIKNAYKTSILSNPSISSMRSSLYQSSDKNKQKPQSKQFMVSSNKFIRSSGEKNKVSNMREVGLDKHNRLEKMIQQKEIAVVSDLKNSQTRLSKMNKSMSKEKQIPHNKGLNKYLSKVELLRKSVEMNNKLSSKQKLDPIGPVENTPSKGENLMRLSTMSKKLPQTVAEIKTPKPKIRLVMQKESFIEDVIKTFLPPQTIEAYKSVNVRKSASSFYKTSQKQKQKQKQKGEDKSEQHNIDIKPVTQYSRTMSASHLSQKQFLKGHSKTKNLFSTSINKKQNKSKSRSISEKSDLSLSKSPNKRFTKQSEEQQKSVTDNTPDEGLRIVNSKLRELTIMSIYGKKTQPNTAIRNPYESTATKIAKAENKDKLAIEDQKNKIDEELREVKTRLKQLSTKKIYERRQSTKGFDKKLKKQEARLIEKQAEIKKQNKINEEELAKKQKEKEALLKNMQIKDQRIQQLLKMLKKQEKEKVEKVNDTEGEEKLREEKMKKMQEIEILKQKIKSQNKLIKEQMEEEEKKYIELKEKEYQIKEEAMIKKHEMDMQQIKEQYYKKNKELEAKIMQEEKVRKEQEIKILKEQRQMEDLKMQMEEKKLKEQLLQEVLKEYRQKEQQQERSTKQSQELKKERLKMEILEKQEIERKILSNFQQDNRKLMEMFESMKRKNEEAEKQNQKKLKQIKKMQQQSKKQQEALKRIEAELLEARSMLEKQGRELKSEKEQIEEPNETQDIQAVKLRVKQQILKQMMAKRKEEETQQQLEKQERAKKLAEIEEEIRNQLKRQEQQMQRIEKEQREKFEKLKNELEEDHRKKMEELEKQIKEEKNEVEQKENDEAEVQDKKEAPQKNRKLDQISKQYYENELKLAIQLSKQKANQKQLEESKQQNNQHQEGKQQLSALDKKIIETQEKKEQKKEQIKQQQKDQKQKQNVLIGQKLQQNKKAQSDNERKPDELTKSQTKKVEEQASNSKLSVEAIADIKKQTQTVKQPVDQILTKYQNLQQYLAKCKQIYVEDKGFAQLLSNFYGQLAPEVKQMMPYSQSDILKFVTSLQKKIDVFEGPSGQSIGWLESEKYVLLGQISCVENVVRKYGQVQIQMTYIFNKTNPYQKQFLAKQVKIFDKVGFIFQKKLKEDNMYSIKLIIKVPTQILPKGFKPPNNQLAIKSKIAIELMKASERKQQNTRYSYSYMLGQTLKHCLSSQEELQFKDDKSEQARLVQAKMHYKIYNDNEFKSEEIDDKKIKWEANLPFKYIQTHDYVCYFTKGIQYSNGGSEKVYAISINSTLSAVVFTYDKSCEGFSLDILTNVKTSKLEKQRQLIVCLPVWKKQEDMRLNYPGPKQFHFSYSVEANLAHGSIINTSVFKDEYKLMETPFAFCLFETNEKGVLMRQLSGEVVEGKDVVVTKR